MGPAVFVIALLGCGDGAIGCTPVATLPRHYASASECAAETGAALIERTDLEYPTILAECRATRPAASAHRQGSKGPAAPLPRG